MSFFTFGYNSLESGFPGLTVMVDTDSIKYQRQLSFADRYDLEFDRNTSILPKAIVLTDIDNDGNDELCICTVDGKLAVYHLDRIMNINKPTSIDGDKNDTSNESSTDSSNDSSSNYSEHNDSEYNTTKGIMKFTFETWLCCVCSYPIGSVTCLVAGDIRNNKKISLIALNAEGKGVLFDFEEEYMEFYTNKNWKNLSKVSNASPSCSIKPSLEFEIPFNVSAAVIGNIETKNQLLLGTHDRKVHSFILRNDRFTETFCWTVKDQITSLCTSFELKESMLESNGEKTYPIVIAGLKGGIYAKISLHTGLSGVCYRGINFESQQMLQRESSEQEGVSDSESDSEDNEDQHFVPLVGTVLSDHFARKIQNQRVFFSEVVGPIQNNNDPSKASIACANFDGILNFQQNGKIQWDIQLDHPIFSLKALDVTGDGNDEILACCWDGKLFIVDQDRNVIDFKQSEPVCGFGAGYLNNGSNNKRRPMITFVEFSGRITLFTNFKFASIVPETCDKRLDKVFQDYPISRDWNAAEKASFVQSCFSIPMPQQRK